MGRRFVNYPPMGVSGYLHTIPRNVVLMAECQACGLQKELDRDALEESSKGMVGLRDIEGRLRCSVCREKDAEVLTGYYVEGDDAPDT